MGGFEETSGVTKTTLFQYDNIPILQSKSIDWFLYDGNFGV